MKPAKTCKINVNPAAWSDMLWGDYYRDALSVHLKPVLAKLYGFHLLKIGRLSTEIETQDCPISHQVNVAMQGGNLQVQADLLHLPFEAKSVDACLLAHTLAWSHDPHRILREVDRVLIDDGWLIVTGFNPISILGIGKLIPGLRRCAPCNSRMFSQTRLLDWLSLLNYEVTQRTGFQVLPWRRQGGRIISKHFPALGCISMLVARKRTLPLTPNPARKAPGKTQLRPAVSATRHYRNKGEDQGSGR